MPLKQIKMIFKQVTVYDCITLCISIFSQIMTEKDQFKSNSTNGTNVNEEYKEEYHTIY